MRALSKCLLVFCVMVTPICVNAQGLGFLPNRKASPAQFEEAIVPSPLEEASPFSGQPANVGDLVDPILDSPVMPLDNGTTPLDGVESYPIESRSASDIGLPVQMGIEGGNPAPLPGEEVMVDSGFGQPYDMPIGDVIPEEGAEVYSTGNWFRGGRWYSQQELVMLLRTDLPAVHVAVDQTRQSAVATLDIFSVGTLSSKDADFTYEAGTRLTLGKILGRDVANRDHGVEFSFLGLFDYTGRSSVSASNPFLNQGIDSLLGTNEVFNDRIQNIGFGFPVVNPVPGFDNADSQSILYQADFNSLEMNYRLGGRPVQDRLVMQPDGRWVRFATPSNIKAIFAGFRYVRQNELFEYKSVGGSNDDGEFGTYTVNTDNDLFGLQFGGEFTEKRTDWVFGVKGKLGGFINFADRQSSVIGRGDFDVTSADPLVNFSRNESLSDETLTILGEAGVYMSYYLRPNTAIRAGYDFMYFNGMATATNNIGLMPQFPKFELTGDSVYHGMNFGFEMTW